MSQDPAVFVLLVLGGVRLYGHRFPGQFLPGEVAGFLSVAFPEAGPRGIFLGCVDAENPDRDGFATDDDSDGVSIHHVFHEVRPVEGIRLFREGFPVGRSDDGQVGNRGGIERDDREEGSQAQNDPDEENDLSLHVRFYKKLSERLFSPKCAKWEIGI